MNCRSFRCVKLCPKRRKYLATKTQSNVVWWLNMLTLHWVAKQYHTFERAKCYTMFDQIFDVKVYQTRFNPIKQAVQRENVWSPNSVWSLLVAKQFTFARLRKMENLWIGGVKIGFLWTIFKTKLPWTSRHFRSPPLFFVMLKIIDIDFEKTFAMRASTKEWLVVFKKQR